MKQLIIFPKGTLCPKDKERMSKEGYLAIEAEDPSKVIMPVPSADLISGNMLLEAALVPLRGQYRNDCRAEAWAKLSSLVTEKLTPPAPPVL